MSAEFDDVEVFTTGTVGEPGQRTFFIQFGYSGSIITLKVEKQQVAALAEYLHGILADLDPTDRDDAPLPLDLIQPIEPAWTIGAIGAAYVEERDRIVLVVEEVTEDEHDETEPAAARVSLSRPQVLSFVERARDLVSSGRPPCPYCGVPLDGDGTWCPCYN